MRHVLRGKDPTQLAVDGIEFDVLLLGGRLRSRFEGCGVAGAVDPVVYLRTDNALTAELCQRVTTTLAATLGTKHVWTHFRNDHWFLCGQFPIQYPYSPSTPPPSEVAFYSLPEFTCSIFCDGSPRCIGPTVTPSRRQERH